MVDGMFDIQDTLDRVGRALDASGQVPAQTSFMDTLEGWLGDRNNQRVLADLGVAFSQGQSAGEALGGTAGANIRRQASQEAGGNLMQQILSALKNDPTGKGILGPNEDPNTLNKVTIDNKGIKLDMPNPNETKLDTLFSGKMGEETPLEGIKSFSQPPVQAPVSTQARNVDNDLRDFFNPSQLA